MESFARGIIERFTGFAGPEGDFFRKARQVVKRVCDKESNCIDIGPGRGRLLNSILDCAPRGEHYIFEPNPEFRDLLSHRFIHYGCHFHHHILGSEVGSVHKSYKIEFTVNRLGPESRGQISDIIELDLPVTTLDEIVPQGYNPCVVKIDGKGNDIIAVVQGAQQMISRSGPHIIFHSGVGTQVGADKAGELYDLLAPHGLRISTLERWVNNQPCFNRDAFKQAAARGVRLDCIAYP